MSDTYRAHLYRRLVESGVPEQLHEGLVEYIAARRPVGHFLTAVLLERSARSLRARRRRLRAEDSSHRVLSLQLRERDVLGLAGPRDGLAGRSAADSAGVRMSDKSNIEWTDATWNPVRGCEKVSPGCANCYAETFAERFRGVKGHPYEQGFDLRLVPEKLGEPQRWKSPKRVFVNSMSDLFLEGVPDEYIAEVWKTMATIRRHTYQVLTKRASRMHALMPRLVATFGVLPNVWLGVSVENQHFADERIPLLLQTPAAVRFISAEPLLGPTDLGLSQAVCGCCERIFSSRWVRVNRRLQADFPLNIVGDRAGKCIEPGVHRATSNRHGALAVNDIGIRPSEFDTLPALDWVIVGGESGSGARPFDLAWARLIVQQCKAANVPVFVKQLGAVPMVPEPDWRTHVPTALLKASNHRRVPDQFVPIFYNSKKGGDPSEWPSDLRVREFPSVEVPA